MWLNALYSVLIRKCCMLLSIKISFDVSKKLAAACFAASVFTTSFQN